MNSIFKCSFRMLSLPWLLVVFKFLTAACISLSVIGWLISRFTLFVFSSVLFKLISSSPFSPHLYF